MSKKCPKCLEIYDDNYGFCSNCGSRLVDYFEEIEKDPVLNIGDANAISGGISINRSKNITTHDTHYHSTTVHERAKSDSELKLEAVNQLRSKVEEILSQRGRIDSVAMEQMRPLAAQLGIDSETFKSIIKDVRSNRNGSSDSLNAANARYLQQAKQAVQTNDWESLTNLLPRLEAMASISQEDDVQYLYHMVLALSDPLKSIETYKQKADENYWRSLWAIVSYIRTENYSEAARELSMFNTSRFGKSEEDGTLMEAYFNLMKDNKDTAQDFLDEIFDEPSQQLKPLHRAIEVSINGMDMDNPEVCFYCEHITSKENSTDIPGDISAYEMYKLAEKYCSEEETEETQRKGLELVLKAAELGFAQAQERAGQIYECGYYGNIEVKEDLSLAEQYYTKAISNGSSVSKLSLSMLYSNRGDRILFNEKNDRTRDKEALMWYDKAINAYPDDIGLPMQRKAQIYSDPTSTEYNMALAFECSEQALMKGDDDVIGVFRYIMGLCYAEGHVCQKDMNKAIELMREAEQAGNDQAHFWLMNNVNNNISEPQAEMIALFSNMRIINTMSYNKMNIRGKLIINNAMNKKFVVTVQWNFWDNGKIYTGEELVTDNVTAPNEFTEWPDFDFGLFNYDTITPFRTPDQHDGECIIRIHEKESKAIIGQTRIECCVKFKLTLFGGPKVQCLDYRFNESNNC